MGFEGESAWETLVPWYLLMTYDKLNGDDAAIRERQQQQFRALGVLPIDLSFRAEHIWALWGETDNKALANLIGDGLLVREEREGWYVQHRLLRSYARALLRQYHEFDAVLQHNYSILLAVATTIFQSSPETWRENDDDLAQFHALGNEIVVQLTGTDDPIEQDQRLRVMSEEGIELEVDEYLIYYSIKFSDVFINYIFRRYIGAEGRRWLWAGLAAAKTANHQKAIGVITSALGSWHEQHAEWLTALTYHRKSLEAARANGDKRNEGASLTSIGGVQGIISEYEQALSAFELALLIFRELGDKRGEATTLNNIGMAWTNQHDYEQALTYFEPALELIREVGDKGGEATICNNIGGVLQQQGYQQQALTYFMPALELIWEVGDKRGEASNLNNIGRSLDRLEMSLEALPYYQNALLFYQEVDDPVGIEITQGNIALNLWRQEQGLEAIERMEISKAIRIRLGLSTERQDYYLVRWREWLANTE